MQLFRTRYRFNIETLQYEKEQLFRTNVLLKKYFFSRLLISLASGVGILYVLLYFFDTPQVKILTREQDQLLTKYHLMELAIDNMSHSLNIIRQRDESIYHSVFEIAPIPLSVRNAGYGGINRYKELQTFNTSQVIVDLNKRLDVLAKQMYIQSVSFDNVLARFKEKEKMKNCIPAIQPIASKHITGFCPFGMRLHPILNYVRLHAGVDLCAAEGTEIHASGDGVVTVARLGKGIGYYVKINHGYGYETLYGHVSKILVHVGQPVKRGEVIALVGTTGLSYVNHLHYEVHKDGVPVDPYNYYLDDLTDSEYRRMIAISSSSPNADFD